MKKLLIIFLLFPITSHAQLKPMLGRQIDWADPSTDGLVGFFPFNEGAGTQIYDITSNGVVATHDGSWTGGKFGACPDFDGVNEYVSLPSTYLGEHLSLTEQTTIIWFRTPVAGVADTSTIWLVFNGFPNAAFLKMAADGTLDLFIRDSASNTVTVSPGTDYGDGNWHMAAVVKTTTETTLYVDAVNVGSDADDTGVITITTSSLGNNGGDSWEGQLDAFTLYNRALTLSDIQRLYVNPFRFMQGDLPVSMMQRVIPVFYYHYVNFARFPVLLFGLYYLRRRKCAA